MRVKLTHAEVTHIIDLLEVPRGNADWNDLVIEARIISKFRKARNLSMAMLKAYERKKREEEIREGQKRLEECV